MGPKKRKVQGMSISKENIRVAATFSREENERLKVLAENDNRSVSNLVSFIVREWLKAQQG